MFLIHRSIYMNVVFGPAVLTFNGHMDQEQGYPQLPLEIFPETNFLEPHF